ncbi:MBL fold metallo-hydrolase [Candidatus Bathyarchaeota archaeon]|nr:MBL fold metallo-hydrolase [Candidatus Bathyarchaeota archaeon]
MVAELAETSKLEIVSLVDNTVDFLSSNSRKEVRTFQHSSHWHTGLPCAENGFSMYIKVYSSGESHSILFDAGTSPDGVCKNAKLMDIDLKSVGFVVLSHGHYDHFGGLVNAVKTINRPDLQIISHEDMDKPRAVANTKGDLREYPTFPKSKELTPANIINTKKPLLIASNLAYVTGEIPRTVSFENGLISNRIYKNASWHPDPLILNERALVFNVKDEGLVIISGCAHSGIINTVRYAQLITGIPKVYAILGGFHLSGKEYEKRINRTVKELRQISPELIIPSHCTGWRAMTTIAKKFPNTFIWNSIGNHYLLGSS